MKRLPRPRPKKKAPKAPKPSMFCASVRTVSQGPNKPLTVRCMNPTTILGPIGSLVRSDFCCWCRESRALREKLDIISIAFTEAFDTRNLEHRIAVLEYRLTPKKGPRR